MELKTKKGKALPSSTEGRMISSKYEIHINAVAKAFFSKTKINIKGFLSID
jgi:hypothetical protein